MDNNSADLLFARLQLAKPAARSVLVAAADATDVSAIVVALAQSIARTGLKVRLADLVGSDRNEGAADANGVQRLIFSRQEKGNLGGLEEALPEFPGYTILRGNNLLAHAPTLLATKLADGVVLVATRGKSSRLDLVRVKAEVEQSGSELLGSVLKS